MTCNSEKASPLYVLSEKRSTGPTATIEKQSFSSWCSDVIVGPPVLHYHSVMRVKPQNVAP